LIEGEGGDSGRRDVEENRLRAGEKASRAALLVVG
jgi:hypothetical protein